jgi:hypothetical protein
VQSVESIFTFVNKKFDLLYVYPNTVKDKSKPLRLTSSILQVGVEGAQEGIVAFTLKVARVVFPCLEKTGLDGSLKLIQATAKTGVLTHANINKNIKRSNFKIVPFETPYSATN